MSRIIRKKLNTESNLATQGLNNDGKLKTFGLFKINSNGTIAAEETERTKGLFLLNPSSFEEAKSVNWSPQNIPGQSNPIYQWISGGPRQISFEALVIRDNFHTGQEQASDPLQSLAQNAINAVGNIASQLAGVSLPPLASLFPSPDPGAGTALSIADKLDYYRSLVHPEYLANYSGIKSSPPLVVLFAGSTFSNAPASLGENISAPNASGSYIPVFIITNLSIKITKQLPNLDPMEAMVGFTLQEYAIRPISSLNFVAGEPEAGPSGFDLLGGLAGAASAISSLF